MLQLAKHNLETSIQKTLDSLQQQVNLAGNSFDARREMAQKLWTTKKNAEGQRAFVKITEALRNICVYVNVCNYCEQNEANDIEHIYPKSYFPDYTFIWENYILACKQCNTAYKLDKCFVLDPDGNVHEVFRGTAPPFQQVAMINPRIEDPNLFLWLNMQTRQFEIKEGLSLPEANKAERTLFILQLNTRDLLLEDRKNTAIYYYERMKTLAAILEAQSIEAIEEILSPHDDLIDSNIKLNELKSTIQENFQKHLSQYKHPSVWYAIKTIERKVNPKWAALFNRIPDAVKW